MAGVVDYSRDIPFVDLFKSSRPWISGSDEKWDDRRPIDLDEDGWVRSLMPGQVARTLMLTKGGHPGGEFIVVYDGQGEIDYGNELLQNQSRPGRQVIRVKKDGAVSFARKVEGLYARYQARSNQLAAEKRSVRRLLDLLIERQLAQRLDQLFAGGEGIGLGALLSGDGKSQDWQDLGSVVSRTLGLPGGAGMYSEQRTAASMERLDYFARGGHRD